MEMKRIVQFFVSLASFGQGLALAAILKGGVYILPIRLFVAACLVIGVVDYLVLFRYIGECEDYIRWLVSRNN